MLVCAFGAAGCRVSARARGSVRAIDCPARLRGDTALPPAVWETFAALKGKYDVKNTRRGWMAELKPAVNTNVLLPVSVSVRHHLSLHPPSLSLSLSLSLFSLRSLSLTSSEEAGGSQSSSTRTCYLCSGVTKDSQVDTTLSERVKLEAYSRVLTGRHQACS